MSNNGIQPLLSNSHDISNYDALPSGRLRDSNIPEQQGNPSLPDINREYSESNLVHRRGAAFDISGNPRSHAPGSSQTSVDSQFKDTAAPAGCVVETQAPNRPIGQRTKCWDTCRGCVNQIDFEKWYEWTAYYIPILEWLPQYKCSGPPYCELILKGTIFFWIYLPD